MPVKVILSIDGGGIRGIIPALFLCEIERRTGKRIKDLFHIYSGTSTGSILCTALCTPLRDEHFRSAREMLSFYMGHNRNRIFPQPCWWNIPERLKSLLFRQAILKTFNDEGLLEVLKGNFGDRTMHNILRGKDLIVPVEIAGEGPAVFMNNSLNPNEAPHCGLYKYDRNTPPHFTPYISPNNFSLVDICKGSCSASPYFPPHNIQVGARNLKILDGGYRLNNSADVSLRFAVNKYPGHNFYMLSIGNQSPIHPVIPHDHNGGILGAVEIMRDVGMDQDGQAFARTFLGENYQRICPANGPLPMCDVSPANIAALWQAGWNMIQELDHAGTLNQICDRLMQINSLPRINVNQNANRHYYPGRYYRHCMDNPNPYNDLNNVFANNGNNPDFEQIQSALNKFYRTYRWYRKEDPLQYPSLSTFWDHEPLHLAAAVGHFPSLLKLLEFGSNPGMVPRNTEKKLKPDSPSFWDWTPLHYAAANNESAICIILLYYRWLTNEQEQDIQQDIDINFQRL
ncbi:unnamed protein product, partial [Rotaria sp. Silwood1]